MPKNTIATKLSPDFLWSLMELATSCGFLTESRTRGPGWSHVREIRLGGESLRNPSIPVDILPMTRSIYRQTINMRVNVPPERGFLPVESGDDCGMTFLVRSSRSSDALIPEMRRAIWQIDPVAIPTLKSMDEQVSDSVAGDRFQAIVLSSFGVAALFVALLGVYAVLADSVTLRRQEFGIRIALGSGKSAMIGLVLRQAAYPVLLGTGVGLMMALIALRWVRSLLYQTPVMDPIAMGGSILLLSVAGTIAAIVPARRAASTDPMHVLRME